MGRGNRVGGGGRVSRERRGRASGRHWIGRRGRVGPGDRVGGGGGVSRRSWIGPRGGIGRGNRAWRGDRAGGGTRVSRVGRGSRTGRGDRVGLALLGPPRLVSGLELSSALLRLALTGQGLGPTFGRLAPDVHGRVRRLHVGSLPAHARFQTWAGAGVTSSCRSLRQRMSSRSRAVRMAATPAKGSHALSSAGAA